jgi:hypothetical protein
MKLTRILDSKLIFLILLVSVNSPDPTTCRAIKANFKGVNFL